MTSSAEQRHKYGAILDAVCHLIEELVPVLLIDHGLKRPIADREGTWLILDDPVVAKVAVDERRQVPNIGVLLHPRNRSRLVCVDIEKFTEPVTQILRRVGISTTEATWRQRTGKGGMHAYYQYEGPPLPRIANKPEGLEIDLLSNGFAIVAPSSTHLDPKGGGPYRWVSGHSPLDIPYDDLKPAPDALIDWWRERATQTQQPAEGPINDAVKGKAWTYITGPIAQGGRNETLAKVAGWLHHFHPPPVVEALLLVVNDARCNPPLDGGEVRSISRSVCRYPQPGFNGHPRAIVNPFKENSDAGI